MRSTWGKSVCFLKKFRLLRTGPAGDTMDTYFDLGGYSFPVTTKSTEAQTWFDRGILWTYGYNHEEAVTCFERAIDADPKCAMAHWGAGYASGPNYNMPWDLFDDAGRAAAARAGYTHARKALDLIDGVTGWEAALIHALPARYPKPDPCLLYTSDAADE